MKFRQLFVNIEHTEYSNDFFEIAHPERKESFITINNSYAFNCYGSLGFNQLVPGGPPTIGRVHQFDEGLLSSKAVYEKVINTYTNYL